MPYDKHNLRFINANIFHDINHDYGPGASDERWEKVQQQLKQFGQNFTITVGGVRAKHFPHGNTNGTHRRPTIVKPSVLKHSSTIRSLPSPKLHKHSIKNHIIDEYDMTYYVLQEFVNSVNTKICFNTFFAAAHPIPPTFAVLFDGADSPDKMVETSGLYKLYTRISYYIRYECNNDAVTFVKQFIEFTNPRNIFNDLEKYILIGIYDTVERTQTTSNSKRFHGGAAKDEILEIYQLSDMLNELNGERDKIELVIDSIYDTFTRNQTDYSNSRRYILQRTKEILKKYGQIKKMGSVDNASSCFTKCCFFPPVPRSSRQASKPFDEFTRECFLDYYTTGLIGFYQGILSGLKAEEEAERIRTEREEIRAASGELTKDQRLIRDQFCSLIAKLGLVLNGEYGVDGTQLSIFSNGDDAMTAKEINLLANWANWAWNPDLHKKRLRPTGARSNIDVELFDFTHDYFEDYRMASDNYPICRTSPNLKYVIDNAAMVPNNLKDYVFCPVSSVADGMRKCNVNQLEEHGSMDFVICDRNDYDALQSRQVPIEHYYRGMSEYNNREKTTVYTIELKTPMLTTPIILKKQIDLAGTVLEAHNVLRETLINIIGFIIKLQETAPVISTIIYNHPNGIFGGLYESLFHSTYPDYPGLDDKLPKYQFEFLTIILNILFKGSGDLFQEINAVCKWGGYADSGYSCSHSVVKYNASNTKSSNDGNALRMFIANDQPSGCRFAFLLLNGYKEFTNEYAFGGYMGIGKTLLVTRADMRSQFKDALCSPNPNFSQSEYILHGGAKNKKRSSPTRKIKKRLDIT